MTKLERCINYLRFGQAGDFIESEDGKTWVMRKDRFNNTLPYCYVRYKGETMVMPFDEAIEVVKKML